MSQSSLLDDHTYLTDLAYDKGMAAGLERAAQKCEDMARARDVSRNMGWVMSRPHASAEAAVLLKAAVEIRQEKKP